MFNTDYLELQCVAVKADITPTVNIKNWTYGDTANTPEVSGNAGNGQITYLFKIQGEEDSTYSCTVPTDAGKYTIKAVVSETGNYNGAECIANFVINKKAAAIVVVDATKVYGDEDPVFTNFLRRESPLF